MSKLMQSPVNKTLASTKGHVIRFERGVTRRVPDGVVEEAMAFGAQVVTEDGQADAEDEQNREEAAQSKAESNVTRKEAIYEAVDNIFVKADNNDFTAANKPKVSAVRERTGFSVERSEIDEALRERNKRLAKQRLGDD